MTPSEIAPLPPARVLAWSESMLEQPSSVENPSIAPWLPSGMTAAIGLSQKAETELDIDAMRRDGVGLVRRQSGGGAVLLYRGVLCWEAWATAESMESSGGDSGIRGAYAFLSRPVVEGLRRLGVEAFSAGICDISTHSGGAGEARKLAGTAQLRRRNRVLVHGSLLVEADVGVLSRYLRFPSEQPEYRRNRPHTDFCLTVRDKLALRDGEEGDLTRRVAGTVAAAARDMGWRVLSPPDELPPEAAALEREKYLNDGWNLSRERKGKTP